VRSVSSYGKKARAEHGWRRWRGVAHKCRSKSGRKFWVIRSRTYSWRGRQKSSVLTNIFTSEIFKKGEKTVFPGRERGQSTKENQRKGGRVHHALMVLVKIGKLVNGRAIREKSIGDRIGVASHSNKTKKKKIPPPHRSVFGVSVLPSDSRPINGYVHFPKAKVGVHLSSCQKGKKNWETIGTCLYSPFLRGEKRRGVRHGK